MGNRGKTAKNPTQEINYKCVGGPEEVGRAALTVPLIRV